IPLPLKICQGKEPCRLMCFQAVGTHQCQHDFCSQICANVWAPVLVLPKERHHSSCNSLTRTHSIDSLATQNMTHLPHDTESHIALTMPRRLGQAVLPMALALGLWLSFSAPTIMAVQAATPSETMIVDLAAEDDPDANLVPLDTEGLPSEAPNHRPATTSSVPRAEDLLQVSPAENSPATARFSDALNP